MGFYRFLVPRLDGHRIDGDLGHYLALVRKGVAGFIVFGGEVGSLRKGIRRLQDEAELPLIIASDLEQGLGQQVRGGTTFPPAAAVAEADASRPGVAEEIFECMAEEAADAGINTVLAPVLDVDTNPENPIISTRAFGPEPATVARLGSLMVKTFEARGIRSCGKHFPGHGGTAVDSHLGLPVVDRPLQGLEECELLPFRAAISSGLRMVMLGHLSVPALEPSGMPASLSEKAVRFLRKDLGFPDDGIIITDALDMGALGSYSASAAALLSLEAGIDVLLHPKDADSLAEELGRSGKSFSTERLEAFRMSLIKAHSKGPQTPGRCQELASEATGLAIRVEGRMRPVRRPHVVVLSDEGVKGRAFVSEISKAWTDLKYTFLTERNPDALIWDDAELIVAVFSGIRAWKGGTAPWVKDVLRLAGDRVVVAASFGNPHLIDYASPGATKIYAWWDSKEAQLEVAKIISPN